MKLLYWDFFGPRAKGTAEHFCKHLEEFFEQNKLTVEAMGVLPENPGHCVTWCKVTDEVYPDASKALKPKRWAEESSQ